MKQKKNNEQKNDVKVIPKPITLKEMKEKGGKLVTEERTKSQFQQRLLTFLTNNKNHYFTERQLSEQLNVRNQQVNQTLKRLREKGMVHRVEVDGLNYTSIGTSMSE